MKQTGRTSRQRMRQRRRAHQTGQSDRWIRLLMRLRSGKSPILSNANNTEMLEQTDDQQQQQQQQQQQSVTITTNSVSTPAQTVDDSSSTDETGGDEWADEEGFEKDEFEIWRKYIHECMQARRIKLEAKLIRMVERRVAKAEKHIQSRGKDDEAASDSELTIEEKKPVTILYGNRMVETTKTPWPSVTHTPIERRYRDSSPQKYKIGWNAAERRSQGISVYRRRQEKLERIPVTLMSKRAHRASRNRLMRWYY